eukprot:SAG11_NODE_38372_length_252_cov_1.333333_1_plen_80_part_10
MRRSVERSADLEEHAAADGTDQPGRPDGLSVAAVGALIGLLRAGSVAVIGSTLSMGGTASTALTAGLDSCTGCGGWIAQG